MSKQKPLKELIILPTSAKTQKELEKELKDEGYDFYSWSDMPDAYYPPHNHSHDECICVIDGKMCFYVAGNEYELEFGKKLYLPKGTIHESRNKTKDKVTYLIGEMKVRACPPQRVHPLADRGL